MGSRQTVAFGYFLRTGRRLALETKFNPYHDPRNGQFTFAPGHPNALSDVITSYGRSADAARTGRSAGTIRNGLAHRAIQIGTPSATEPAGKRTLPQLAQYPPNPRARVGGNSRAFYDPLTLHQAFPTLRNAPGGSIIAVADGFFNLTGPANAATEALSSAYTRKLIQEIKDIDPDYRFETLAEPQTLQGRVNQLDGLRLDRAAALYRKRGEIGPLQVETLRFLQRRADAAYEVGRNLLRAGKLNIRLSPNEAVGNYIDRIVRREVQDLYSQIKISTVAGQRVRVNSREYDTSQTDATYRRPDVRVGNIAFDVTLSRKIPTTPQVRGFFSTDFRPDATVIVRPTQLGSDSSYVITRPRS